MHLNRESLLYIGQRHAIEKAFQGHRYVFKQGKPVSVPDEMAAELLKSPSFIRADEVAMRVTDKHPDGGTILMRRWGAMGDLIMFRAAVSALVRARPNIRPVLRCQSRFVHLFAHDPLWAGVWSIDGQRIGERQTDGTVSFDQVAEADHRGVETHRVELFMDKMTDEPLKLLPEDWRLPISADVEAWVDRHLRVRGIHPDQRDRPLVAIQVRGSGPMKTLPIERMKAVVEAIADFANVILIEPLEEHTRAFGDSVHKMVSRDVLHGIALLRKVDLAVTMDSGALWMAHAAPSPVLAILGPTRAAQRITHHPLYPARARAVALNDLISCPPCFERAEACGGKFSCLRDQPNWDAAVRAIVGEAESILNGDVALTIASSRE